ncbi:hypothetical protein MKEN_00833600 [Mycena kentingensis (nom. inval.)]|nr:hypothetical protein MKEN_00833600 [Mycena kentingensis (nom. inval.)]
MSMVPFGFPPVSRFFLCFRQQSRRLPFTPTFPMASAGLDSPLLLGVLEIGVFISLVLFGIVFLQGFAYFSRSCARDPLWLKFFVGIILTMELAHTVCAAHAIYYFTILQAGTPARLKKANTYSLSLTPVFETLITAMVQAFFAWRIRQLSGRRRSDWRGWCLPTLCWVLCLVRFVGGMAMAVEGFLDIPLQPNYFHYADTYAWIISGALDVGVLLDVIITLSMCWYIRKLNSPYNLHGSEVLIRRLVNWTIQTGLITSLTSIAVVITFWTMKHNFIWLALYTLLAKLYSNSLLVSLNARPMNRALVRPAGADSAQPALRTWSPSPSPRHSLDSRDAPYARLASEVGLPSRTPSPAATEGSGFLTVPDKTAYVRGLA